MPRGLASWPAWKACYCWRRVCFVCLLLWPRPGRSGREDYAEAVVFRSVCFVMAICIWKQQQQQQKRRRTGKKAIGGIIIGNMRNGKCTNAARFTVNLTVQYTVWQADACHCFPFSRLLTGVLSTGWASLAEALPAAAAVDDAPRGDLQQTEQKRCYKGNLEVMQYSAAVVDDNSRGKQQHTSQVWPPICSVPLLHHHHHQHYHLVPVADDRW